MNAKRVPQYTPGVKALQGEVLKYDGVIYRVTAPHTTEDTPGEHCEPISN